MATFAAKAMFTVRFAVYVSLMILMLQLSSVEAVKFFGNTDTECLGYSYTCNDLAAGHCCYFGSYYAGRDIINSVSVVLAEANEHVTFFSDRDCSRRAFVAEGPFRHVCVDGKFRSGIWGYGPGADEDGSSFNGTAVAAIKGSTMATRTMAAINGTTMATKTMVEIPGTTIAAEFEP